MEKHKTEKQLINELAQMRQRIAEWEASEAECRRAQEALRESEERYRSMMESIDIGINLMDCDHNIVMVNADAAKEMIGKKCYREFEKRDAVCPHCPGVQAIATGQPAEVETVGVRADDGSRFNVLLRAFPIFWQDGTVRGFIEIGLDITERKRAEEALVEERTLLRTVIDNLPDLIYAKDTESRFVIGNIAVARLMGATPDELLGKTDFDFYPQELAKQYYADEQEIIRSGQPLINREEPLMDQLTGRKGWLSTTKVPLRNSEGKIVGIVGIGQDITERKRVEEELAYMATHDALTGLPNRWLFNDRLTLELARAYRNRQKVAVMLLDLDHFKDVNDTLGHSVGDKLLQVVGERLTSIVRKSDTVARMGGDEFMLLSLFPGIRREEDAVKIAQRILQAFRKPFIFDDHEIRITTSIGIAIYPYAGKDADTLIKNADIAMYCAKQRGRDNYQRYSSKEGRDG
jgi:diguanylate cyclase (GGDEF)-like protein/PAS domain S-box-containing protein